MRTPKMRSVRSGVVLSTLRSWLAPAMVAVLAAGGLGAGLCACSGNSSNPPATSPPGTGGQAPSSGSGGAGTGGGAAPSGSGGTVAPGSGGATTVGTGGSSSSGSGGGPIASGGAGPAGTGGGAVQGSGGGAAGKSGGGGSGPGAGGGATGGKGPGAGGDGFVDLFNGTDLTGFNVYKATTSANNAPGMLLTGADALAIFKPENGTIHVYADQPDKSLQYHYLLQTVNPYANFNVSWEYKWGTKKFALDGTGKGTDLVAYPRDAGVLWYIHGDKTQVWPSSIEFQNKWGTSGDIFALYAQCKSLGLANNLAQYAAGGVTTTVIGGLTQHKRSDNFETPGAGADASNGGGSDWNTCLLSVTAGTSTYTLNGHVVNGTLGVMDSSGKPVNSGYLAWQGEQAEVYYRNLRIQVLP